MKYIKFIGNFSVRFELVSHRTYNLFKSLYLPIYLIEGNEKKTGKLIKILYSGNKKSFLYLSNILFKGNPSYIKLGERFFWQLKKFEKKYLLFEVDVVILKGDRFYKKFLQRNNYIILPEWISFILDTSQPIEKIYNNFNTSAKRGIKKMKKIQYSFDVFSDSFKKNIFYDKMFLPYISKIDKTSTISKLFLQYIKNNLQRGVLLLIKREDNYVGGTLNTIVKKQVHLICMGIINGNINFLGDYMSEAIYYFNILWAKENGINLLDFGHTHAFLNDGLLRYKRKWGMTIQESDREFGIFGLKINNMNKGVEDFLTHNPFIYRNDKQLKAFVYLKKQSQITSKEVKRCFRFYDTSGLSKMTIASNQLFSEEAEKYVSVECPQKITLIKENLDNIFKKIS